jgi:hypothetical protein
MQYLKSYFLFGLLLLLILLVGAAVPGCSKNTGTPAVKSSLQEPAEKGDPEWWEKQPDLKKEDAAINVVIGDFNQALTTKNIEQAVTCFSPDARDNYRKVFALSPDLMPQMANDLKNATLTFLSLDTDFTLNRIAEYSFKVDGNTFYIVFIKVGENWMIDSY